MFVLSSVLTFLLISTLSVRTSNSMSIGYTPQPYENNESPADDVWAKSVYKSHPPCIKTDCKHDFGPMNADVSSNWRCCLCDDFYNLTFKMYLTDRFKKQGIRMSISESEIAIACIHWRLEKTIPKADFSSASKILSMMKTVSKLKKKHMEVHSAILAIRSDDNEELSVHKRCRRNA